MFWYWQFRYSDNLVSTVDQAARPYKSMIISYYFGRGKTARFADRPEPGAFAGRTRLSMRGWEIVLIRPIIGLTGLTGSTGLTGPISPTCLISPTCPIPPAR